MSIDLDAVRRVINPPDRIESFEHLNALIHSDQCHTVVEGKFYDEVVGIFQELSDAGIGGDIVVAGVWKGGSSVYLHALNHHFGLGRRLWLADTFYGFDTDTIRHDKDREALRRFAEELRYAASFPSPSDVQRLFERCGLWDGRVTIMAGQLEESLQRLPEEALALVHIDVDFYEPTRAALELTYDRLSPGGYVIIDDYGVGMFNCRDAVEDFRAERGIREPVSTMTDYIAYWRKEARV